MPRFPHFLPTNRRTSWRGQHDVHLHPPMSSTTPPNVCQSPPTPVVASCFNLFVQLQPSLLFRRKGRSERRPDWLSIERKLGIQNLELICFCRRQTRKNPPPILVDDVNIRFQDTLLLRLPPALLPICRLQLFDGGSPQDPGGLKLNRLTAR